jgi:predicted transcriptional regulator
MDYLFQMISYSLLTGEAKSLGFFGDIDDALFLAEKLEVKAIATAIIDQDGYVCHSSEFVRSVSDNSRRYFVESKKFMARIMSVAVPV